MSIAEGMVACFKGKVGSPMIMHHPLGQSRQDADFGHGFPSSFPMQIVECQPFCTGAMDPVKLALYTETALITVYKLGHCEQSFDFS